MHISSNVNRFLPYSFVRVFILSLLVTSTALQLFNMAHTQGLVTQLQTNFHSIFETIRRFGSYYNNSSDFVLNKGVHENDGVSLLVRQDNMSVKHLSPGILKLRTQLEALAPNSIWTVAVLENPSLYAHFLPLRQQYTDAFEQYRLNDVIERVVVREQLNNTYQEFYECNVRLSEPYVEKVTEQPIRTVYYPIHNHQALDALVSVDLNESYIQNQIDAYNDLHYTTLNIDGKNNAYTTTAFFPCSNAITFSVGFSFTDIIMKALWPSLLLAVLYQLGSHVLRKQGRSIKTDEMTNLYRRDYYEPKLKRMTSFSLLVLDIDHFKQINDQHGHAKGDEVLAKCARIISSQIRTGDAAIRWGGEEFIIVFKNMHQGILVDKAEQIRLAIANEKIAGLDVTVSIGGLTTHQTTFVDAYKIADTALYESKHRGRNRVTIL
ncbi:GGDEF domain-containing protein [Enterovibrio sp. ZSDZ42]|uniref:diguanylate cyclase n=1 Tax=Enterovibrio gelatinilyticus TaxID=2899819 RepID=A0ABT5R527_9GAMM|nr:GGDEF domain-containing protein [Enterovibrio sp. ZSDZ42]MDD1795384.1 GGDEF domain-containing protein [Enterovibrio sp. ZSDZ42]